jgi:tRNA threonylcarbamoyladenosine biosynthesis protein TsaB
MILAIETATELCGVALVHGQECIGHRIVIEKNIHSERLMVLVDDLLREADVPVRSLDGVAVSIGPGSFTGLRIGLSVAKGLAYACGLPLLAVPTLDAIAYEAVRAAGDVSSPVRVDIHVDMHNTNAGRDVSRPGSAGLICAAIDAKRDEAYYAFYEPAAGDIRCISTHAIASVSEIAAQFPADIRVVIAGDGARKLAAALNGEGHDTVSIDVLCSPVAVGLLAERRFALLEVADFSELEPVYIRDFVTTVPRIASQTPIP